MGIGTRVVTRPAKKTAIPEGLRGRSLHEQRRAVQVRGCEERQCLPEGGQTGERAGRMQVLIHSPDAARLAALAKTLQAQGIPLRAVLSPTELLNKVHELSPPLVIADPGSQDPAGERFFTAWQASR